MSKTNGQSLRGVSLDSFSLQTGIRKGKLLHYCRTGRIQGAEFNRKLWAWRIYPPAKLVFK